MFLEYILAIDKSNSCPPDNTTSWPRSRSESAFKELWQVAQCAGPNISSFPLAIAALSLDDLMLGYGPSNFRFCLAITVMVRPRMMVRRMIPVHLRIFLNRFIEMFLSCAA